LGVAHEKQSGGSAFVQELTAEEMVSAPPGLTASASVLAVAQEMVQLDARAAAEAPVGQEVG